LPGGAQDTRRQHLNSRHSIEVIMDNPITLTTTAIGLATKMAVPPGFRTMIDANDERVMQQVHNAEGIPQRQHQLASYSTSAIHVDPEVIRAGLVKLPNHDGGEVPQPVSSAFPRFSPLARQQQVPPQGLNNSPLIQPMNINVAPNPFVTTNLFGMPPAGLGRPNNQMIALYVDRTSLMLPHR
ncbi:hypothetical protein FOZ62_001047, partial [Perkinsus olseni]